MWLKVCDSIDHLVLAGCRWVVYVSTTILFFLLAINVILRYAAGTSLQSAGEAPELLFPWLVIVGVVLAAQSGAHIGIVWIVEKFRPRVRLYIAMCHSLILVAGYSVLAWAAFLLLPVVHLERSHVLGVPTSVTFLCAMLGFVLLAITAITRLVRMHVTQTISGHATFDGDN
jgi:TRAP-type C4-dicarboxylate transport system permease small subunit